MRFLLDVVRTGITLLSGLVATVFCATAALVVSRFAPDGPLIERIITAWANAWIVPAGVRVELHGAEHIDPGRSYVLVANHLSNYDIFASFAALPIPIRFLAKQELFRIPLLAPAMRAVGIVEVDRSSRGAAIASINRESVRVVERGHSLIIYPEGTRSRSGSLASFKKGAFAIAIGTRLPVLPVTVHGTRQVWTPERPIIRGGRTITITVDPAIPTEGLRLGDADALRERTRAVIAARLVEQGDPVGDPDGDQS